MKTLRSLALPALSLCLALPALAQSPEAQPAQAPTQPAAAQPAAAVAQPAAEATALSAKARDLLLAIDVSLTAQLIEQAGITLAQLKAALADAESPRYMRQRALWALAHIGGEEARALVRGAALGDRDEEVRTEGALVIARGFAARGVRAAYTDLDRIIAQTSGKVAELARKERKRLPPLR